jgi:translation initiation factor RLI1
MLGQNGTGKTTFIRMLAGLLPADDDVPVPKLNVSYKPQKISPKFEGTVRMLLIKRIKEMFMHPQFTTDVTKPLNLDNIIDQTVSCPLSDGLFWAAAKKKKKLNVAPLLTFFFFTTTPGHEPLRR